MHKQSSYKQLTTFQWLLGFMRIWQEEQNPPVREHMADYMIELLQDVYNHSW